MDNQNSREHNTSENLENSQGVNSSNSVESITEARKKQLLDALLLEKKTVNFWEKIDVNFSDMTQTIEDKADEKVYNEDSKDYVEAIQNKNTRFGKMLVSAKHAMLWDWFRYKKMYWSNPFSKENKKWLSNTMKHDKKNEWLDLTENWANIAWVHGSKTMESVFNLTEWDTEFSSVYHDISNLAYSYYQWESSFVWDSADLQFEKDIKDIFERHPDFTDYLENRGVDIESSASDILKPLRMKKAQNSLKTEISYIVDKTLSDMNWLQWDDTKRINIEDKFVSDMAKKMKDFTSDTKLFPEILQHYNKKHSDQKLNLSESYEDISRKLFPHLDVLRGITTESMTTKLKLNIKFLSWWRSTDHIEKEWDEKLKRWKNPIAKLGEKVYGKWYKWRRLPTKVLWTWLIAWAWVVLMWPLWGILAGSAVAWSFAASKKAAQLKRKKDSLEKKYIKWNNDTSNFKEEDKEQQEYLNEMRGILDYDNIKDKFDTILSNSPLTTEDQSRLKDITALVLAWMEFQKKTGHNAFSLNFDGSDTEKEHAYDKAMNDLDRYKEISFRRLNLEWDFVDEDRVKKWTKYQSILEKISGKNSAFKKFMEENKKERRKELRKTWWRTAWTYAALWGLTVWLSHVLDWFDWSGVSVDDIDADNIDADKINVDDMKLEDIAPDDVDVDDIDSGDMDLEDVAPDNVGWIDELDLGEVNTKYKLWEFDSNPDFAKDISNKFDNLPSDVKDIKVDYSAGVDGTPANAASFNLEVVNSQVDQIKDLLKDWDFSQETIDSVNEAIDGKNINKMVQHAKSRGADSWNSYLFTSRNLEGIYETLDQVDGKTELNLDFSFDKWDSIIWNDPLTPDDRITGIELTSNPEEIIPEDTVPKDTIPKDTIPKKTIPGDTVDSSDSGPWRKGQWVYNEDNTHKWEEKNGF